MTLCLKNATQLMDVEYNVYGWLLWNYGLYSTWISTRVIVINVTSMNTKWMNNYPPLILKYYLQWIIHVNYLQFTMLSRALFKQRTHRIELKLQISCSAAVCTHMVKTIHRTDSHMLDLWVGFISLRRGEFPVR